MSQRFDLLCVDHDDRLYIGNANWAAGELWAWIDSADLIDEFLGHPDQEGMLELNRIGWYADSDDSRSPAEFVRQHRRCQMVPVSEYGYDDRRPWQSDRVQGPNRRLIDGRSP